MLRSFKLILFVIILSTALVTADNKSSEPIGDTIINPEDNNKETIIVYYFYSDHRCATCKKFEAYSYEAIEERFEKRISDSSLVWQLVNYDHAENEHYLKDYKLYTKAIILSKIIDGKEVEWKNLDKIWGLVGEKEDYINYIQNEIAGFTEKSKK